MASVCRTGDFETAIYWTIETWGGHPDLSFFLDSYHSEFIKPVGEIQPPRNLQRWEDPRLDELIERNRTIAFDSPEVVQLGQDFLKLAVEEMPMIPLMAYNKFAPFDTTYWTGYPSVDNPVFGFGPQLVEHPLHGGCASRPIRPLRSKPKRPGIGRFAGWSFSSSI